MRTGDLYRLVSPYEGAYTAFQFVSPDQSDSLAVVVLSGLYEIGPTVPRIMLEGLLADAVYRLEMTDCRNSLHANLSGRSLMEAGVVVILCGDADSVRMKLTRIA